MVSILRLKINSIKNSTKTAIIFMCIIAVFMLFFIVSSFWQGTSFTLIEDKHCFLFWESVLKG